MVDPVGNQLLHNIQRKHYLCVAFNTWTFVLVQYKHKSYSMRRLTILEKADIPLNSIDDQEQNEISLLVVCQTLILIFFINNFA